MANRSWQVPDANAEESYRLGWIREACQDGQNWNKSQPGYNDWEKSLHIFNGTAPKQLGNTDEFRDYLYGRRLRTNVRTGIAGLANIRPMWGYRAPKSHEAFALMWNKTSRALYLMNHWGRDIKDWLSYAAATNTGFLKVVYRRGMAGMGEGNIEFLTYGQPCVLPVQMPASGKYNDAYVVNLMDEIPIFEAHSRFPLYQDRLKPTKSTLWYSQEIRGAAENNASKRKPFNPFTWRGNKFDTSSDLYIPICYSTIIDVSMNMTGQTIPMGQPGTSWYYEVPSYGTEIGTGQINPATGSEGTRLANEDDCRLYPNRRLQISSEDCIMYDGPAFNWDGNLDLIDLAVDKWPWAPGGFGMVHDGAPIERSLNAIDSGIMTRVRAQNNLPLGYDLNSVTKEEAEAFDPMSTDNDRVGYDGSEVEGTPFKLLVPFDVYKIYPEQLEFRKALIESLDFVMQFRDLVELSKVKALGKDMEAMDKILSSMGPIVRDIGVEMETKLGRVGNLVAWRIAQYMTASRIMEYIGPEAVPTDLFDYEPNDLYPSHLPDEEAHDGSHKMKPSKYTAAQRAKWMVKRIRFVNVPNSIHQVHQMSTVLTLLQLKQRGMMISDYTVENAASVSNIEPPDGNTEAEMWLAEMEDKISVQARLAAITQQVAGEQGLGGAPGAPPPGGKGKGKGGRPPTAQTAPHQEVKGDGRPVISESK